MSNPVLSKPSFNNSSLEIVTYCFELTLSNQKRLRLTSSKNIIICNDIKYMPFTGLSIKEMNYNESGQDITYLHGIFEKEGIGKDDDLLNARIKISFYNNEKLEELFTLYCTEVERQDLEFWLKLEPEIIKFNRSILLTYSKTCRANLGDDKCRISNDKIENRVMVTEIVGNILKFNDLPYLDGYFTNGEAKYFKETEFYKSSISWHKFNQIEVSKAFVSKIKAPNEIILIPGCDKKFITCCNKFNNELNFRGEPFIPDNYLKN